MRCNALAQCRLAGSSDAGQAGNKVVLVGGNVEWEPGELGGGNVDARVDGEVVGLGRWVVGKVSLWYLSVVAQVDAACSRTHESLMRNCWPCAVQPRLLVHVSGGNKGRRRHLLGVKTKAHASGAVLAVWDGAWNGLGFEAAGQRLALHGRARVLSVCILVVEACLVLRIWSVSDS